MIKRKRGVSELIGGAIVFTILFTTVLSYGLVINDTNHDYQTTAILRSISDRDKGLEQFTIGTFALAGNIALFINNTGSLPTNILAIFISNSTHHFFYNETSSGISPPLPMPINPFSTSLVIDTGLGFVSDEVYEVKALSSRGQLGSGRFPAPQSPSAVFAAVSGFLTLDASTLEWAEWSLGSTPSTVTWSADPEIPKNDYIVWRGNIDNHNTDDFWLRDHSIVSVLRAVPKTGDEVYMFWWYLVDSSNFEGYSDFSHFIPAGGSATVIWGSEGRGQGVNNANRVDIDFGGQYVVSLIFFGRWVDSSGEDYGQVISYAGILVE